MVFGLLVLMQSSLLSQKWTEQDIEIYNNFDDLEYIFEYSNDTTYLINFWATWCGPCVKEMPYIESLKEEYASEDFEIILVSLDFKKQIQSRLIPYLNKNNIQSKVVLLLDDKANDWIDKVDKNWTGAIPITLIYNKSKRLFFETEFHSKEELVNILNPILKNKNYE